MSTVKSELTDSAIVIYLTGKIDSSNADSTEAEVNECLSTYSGSSAIIDISDLKYISSAGLRFILRLKKAMPDTRIINASQEVYEIFDMTGFTEMLTVEKAYRRLSVDGCEVIGEGANGKVYRINPETIIKVYFNPDSLPDIQRERELARRAFVLGIPTAISYDVVKVGESYGSVFELLNAESLSTVLRESPAEIDRCVDIAVALLKKLHSTEVKPEDMPDMRDVVIGWAKFIKPYIPSDKADKLIGMVENVPVVHRMIHGDYHLKNIMMQNGEALLIDMDTLCQGHPVFELASVFNAYVGFSETDSTRALKFVGIPYECSAEFWKKFLPRYLDTDNMSVIESVENKARLLGYTRLMRRLIRRNGFADEKSKREIEIYRAHIIELIDTVDSLVF